MNNFIEFESAKKFLKANGVPQPDINALAPRLKYFDTPGLGRVGMLVVPGPLVANLVEEHNPKPVPTHLQLPDGTRIPVTIT